MRLLTRPVVSQRQRQQLLPLRLQQQPFYVVHPISAAPPVVLASYHVSAFLPLYAWFPCVSPQRLVYFAPRPSPFAVVAAQGIDILDHQGFVEVAAAADVQHSCSHLHHIPGIDYIAVLDDFRYPVPHPVVVGMVGTVDPDKAAPADRILYYSGIDSCFELVVAVAVVASVLVVAAGHLAWHVVQLAFCDVHENVPDICERFLQNRNHLDGPYRGSLKNLHTIRVA
mmetsp:Transcript_12629/g.20408  ORF Transcript_12629/g.20408 Transcript_12629/m.20408 type:complete len:226 (+) Transcript_12629:2660-3337(+)